GVSFGRDDRHVSTHIPVIDVAKDRLHTARSNVRVEIGEWRSPSQSTIWVTEPADCVLFTAQDVDGPSSHPGQPRQPVGLVGAKPPFGLPAMQGAWVDINRVNQFTVRQFQTVLDLFQGPVRESLPDRSEEVRFRSNFPSENIGAA